MSFQPVPGGRPLLRPRDVAEPPVAEADQVLGQFPAAPAVVEGQRDRPGPGRRRPPAQHHSRPGLRELAQLRRHRRLVPRVLHRPAGQHHGRRPLALEQGEVGQLAFRAAAGVADHGESLAARSAARPPDLGLDRAGHDAEEGVGDVVDQDAHQVRGGRRQRARGAVEDVVQLVDRLEHPLARGRGDGIVPVQHARHRRGGDLGAGRHVRQGHRHVLVLRLAPVPYTVVPSRVTLRPRPAAVRALEQLAREPGLVQTTVHRLAS